MVPSRAHESAWHWAGPVASDHQTLHWEGTGESYLRTQVHLIKWCSGSNNSDCLFGISESLSSSFSLCLSIAHSPAVWSDTHALIIFRATSGWLKSSWWGMAWKPLASPRRKLFSRKSFLSTITPLASSTPSSLAKSLWSIRCWRGMPRSIQIETRKVDQSHCSAGESNVHVSSSWLKEDISHSHTEFILTCPAWEIQYVCSGPYLAKSSPCVQLVCWVCCHKLRVGPCPGQRWCRRERGPGSGQGRTALPQRTPAGQSQSAAHGGYRAQCHTGPESAAQIETAF